MGYKTVKRKIENYQKNQEHKTLRSYLLTYSYRDPLTSELVYTPESSITLMNNLPRDLNSEGLKILEQGEVLTTTYGYESPVLNQINKQ